MDVLMPQLGETVAEGKISKWFVSAGDTVKPGDNLFEIETDKVSMEVPAIAAGTLAEIRVSAGEVETARKAPAPAPMQAVAHIVLTADVAIGQALALCADVKAIELTDVIVKAWATALARMMPPDGSGVSLTSGKERAVIRGA